MKNIIKIFLNFIWKFNVNNKPRVIYYHSVGNENPLSHSLSSFDSQLAWLKENGYECPPLSEILKSDLKKKTIFITFDDGYYDNLKNALPLLQKYNYKATFFICTDYINLKGRYDSSKGHMLYDGLQIMNINDIKELIHQGMEIGSHSKSHKMITTLKIENQVEELVESIFFLERNFKIKINSFAYPNGQRGAVSNSLNKYVAERTDIKLICSTLWGTVKRNKYHILHRCEMSNLDSLYEFISKIKGKRDYRYIIDRMIDKSKAWYL